MAEKDSLNDKQTKQNKVIIIYDLQMNQHQSIKVKHVECPQRTIDIIQRIKQCQLQQKNKQESQEPEPKVQNNKVDQKVHKLQFDIIDKTQVCPDSVLLLCHSQVYIDHVESCSIQKDKSKDTMWDEPSTYYNKYTPECARLAVNACCQAIDKVFANNLQYDNAFAIVRPPGHHAGDAEVSTMFGFCVYNNAGCAARYAQTTYQNRVKKVVIFDWDVHHGNGTQSIFYQDDSVLYISVHRYDNGFFFPSTQSKGCSSYVGQGKGEGFNINIGWNTKILPRMTVGDNEYIFAFESIIFPIITEFNPDLIIVSAGFDAIKGDPVQRFKHSQIGQLDMSDLGYCYMLQRLMQIQPRIVCILEGGYNTQEMSVAIEAVLHTLCGIDLVEIPSKHNKKLSLEQMKDSAIPNDIALLATQFAFSNLKPYWKCLTNSKELSEYQRRIKVKVDKGLYGFIAAGYTSKFIIEECFKDDPVWTMPTLLKYTNEKESTFYQDLYPDEQTNSNSEFTQENIYLQKNVAQFVEIYQNSNKEQNQNLQISSSEIQNFENTGQQQKQTQMSMKIRVQNLFHNMPFCSIVDFGLGEYDMYQKASGQFDCLVNGYIFKDSNGLIMDKQNQAQVIKNQDALVVILEQLLRSNDAVKVNLEALSNFTQFSSDLLDFIQSGVKRSFSQASLLFLVDNLKSKFVAKIINFQNVEKLPKNKKDFRCANKIKHLLLAFNSILENQSNSNQSKYQA